MICPCGARAVSFGPFGNACGLCEQALTQNTERVRLERHLMVMREIGARPHLQGFQFLYANKSNPKTAVVDASLCACGARASRWYEGGQSCWFCVPRRTTQDEVMLATMVHEWTKNMDRVEAVARRQHRRWAVLNIARQTKDQYPVALRDWELWQVAKVQEDGRLKKVLEKSKKYAGSLSEQSARMALALAITQMNRLRAEQLALLAQTDLNKACCLAGVDGVITDVAVDPAPYFAGPKEWEAAFYKALQSVPESLRAYKDTKYRSSWSVVIGATRYLQGSPPESALPF